jgi:hypothetical protein
VYRDGGGLFSLSFVTCTNFNGQALFLGHAGTTYVLQSVAQCCGNFGSITTNLQQVPAPVPQVSFSFFPSDPSGFDLVQFFDQSSDPGQQPISGHHWDFGDGGTADTTCCPSHRFTADGDYVVTLTSTTADGRSGTGTRTVHVQTHDVAVDGFKVPQSASVGQTKPITVGIKNTATRSRAGPARESVPVTSSASDNRHAATAVCPKGEQDDRVSAQLRSPDDGAIGRVVHATATLSSARDAPLSATTRACRTSFGWPAPARAAPRAPGSR